MIDQREVHNFVKYSIGKTDGFNVKINCIYPCSRKVLIEWTKSDKQLLEALHCCHELYLRHH